MAVNLQMATSNPRYVPLQRPDGHRDAVCPNCNRRVRFRYAGEQELLLRVVKGMDAKTISLWTCEQCHSTFGETDIS